MNEVEARTADLGGIKTPCLTLPGCRGFGQDRVNFHQKLGGVTAGRLTQTDQTEQGIRYYVLSCWVLRLGELSGGS